MKARNRPHQKEKPRQSEALRFLALYFTVIMTDFEVIAPELFQFFTTMECDPLPIET